jgi:hypothetical protein
MSGPKPNYPISLSEAERTHLEGLVRAHKSGQTQVMRAQILLSANAHPEWSNQQIAVVAGTSDRIVRKWRQRWVTSHSIADAPRTGAPRRFSPSSTCPSHSHCLQFATTEPSTASPLESPHHSKTGSSHRERNPFQQNSRTVVKS